MKDVSYNVDHVKEFGFTNQKMKVKDPLTLNNNISTNKIEPVIEKTKLI